MNEATQRTLKMVQDEFNKYRMSGGTDSKDVWFGKWNMYNGGQRLPGSTGDFYRSRITEPTPVVPSTSQPPSQAVNQTFNDYSNAMNGEISKQQLIGDQATAQYDVMGGYRDYVMGNYYDTMKRLMEREERYGTGNPFIDMIEAYSAFRKRKNPNYRFGGIADLADKGFNGLMGLIGANKSNVVVPQQPQTDPVYTPIQGR